MRLGNVLTCQPLNALQGVANDAACAERLLDVLPPIFHEPWSVPASRSAEQERDQPPPEAG